MTPIQKSLLIKHYATKSNADMCDLLGISSTTLWTWSRRLGLRKSEAYMRQALRMTGFLVGSYNRRHNYEPQRKTRASRKHIFTPEVIAEAERRFSNEGTRELAEELGVDFYAFKKMAYKRGWRKSREYVFSCRQRASLIAQQKRLNNKGQ